jgi:hypothetical protein
VWFHDEDVSCVRKDRAPPCNEDKKKKELNATARVFDPSSSRSISRRPRQEPPPMKVICGLSKSKFKEKLKPLRAVFMKMVLRYKAGCDVRIRRSAQSQAAFKDKNATAELRPDVDRAKVVLTKLSSARTMELWIKGGKKDMTADDGTIYRCLDGPLDGPLRTGNTKTRKTSPKPKTKKKEK